MTKAKKVAEKKQPEYSIVLNCGKLYEVSGETVLECLEKLTPEAVKTRSVLTFKKGTKSFIRNLVPIQMKRLMINPVFRQIIAKQVTIVLND